MSIQLGFVSSYPPTLCGLATFASALRSALVGQAGPTAGPVVQVIEAPQAVRAPEVVVQVTPGDLGSLSAAAAELNRCDAAVLQHEYGIYGGRDGDEVLLLLEQLRVPAIVVLHTVLTEPTANQKRVLEAVCSMADAVVTMTATARDRVAAGYRVDMARVVVIPHGASDVAGTSSARVTRATGDPFTVLTWGLLGPGKGIEWAIEAMALLGDVQPAPHYVIAGQTHPKVLQYEGEAYRGRLEDQVARLGLQQTVRFDRRYRDTASLGRLVQSADLVLLPYDSTQQVTSGVLIEAVAAGKPVIATRFPHAVELLGAGAGLVVDHRDPAAIAHALRTIITRRDVADRMADAAAHTAPELRWSVVAEKYTRLARQLVAQRVAA